MKRKAWIGGMIISILLIQSIEGTAQPSLRVRVNRWLELRDIKGIVNLQRGNQSQRAKNGDRLQAAGDGITTAKNASVNLLVDTGIGLINVSEDTVLRVQELDIAPDNGRITRLQVTKGQARLKVRKFTHQGSRLEIRTPASLSGVRGTEFGVAIQPNGKTGLAVLEGRIASAAQGRSVPVDRGFQNFTIPGEAPSTPVPLKNDTRLQHRFEMVIEGNVRRVRLIGQVDPVNSVKVEGVPQVTDRNGRFRTDLRPLTSFLRLRVEVITPLGTTKTYDLAFE